MKLRWGFGILLIIFLTGCNLGSGDENKTPETTISTPIAWATRWTVTAPPEASHTPIASATPAINTPVAPAPTLAPTNTSAPTAIAVLPTVTDAPTLTALPSATVTPPPSLTPQILPSVTTTPTLTRTAFVIFTLTPSNTPVPLIAPTNTPAPTVAPLPTTTPVIAYTQPPTFTPFVLPTAPALPTLPPFASPTADFGTPLPTSAAQGSAQVCASCGGLRLRQSPGTAGSIVTELDANTFVTVVGRTADNVWVQIVMANGTSGWVAAQYLTINFDLNTLAVTGNATDTTVPTPENPAGIDVITGVSSNARQIFLNGRARGNSAYTFTRVGDSITASPYFLTQIGQGAYQLGDYGYLGGAISFFSGPNGQGANPFVASSGAAHNGWSTESVLNPGKVLSGACRAGETPLECEYRLTKPSVALIMLGTNDSGGMPIAEFQRNLQRIAQISIDMGVIPVFSTIPPKHYNPATDGRVPEFNQVIIATARAYDVPLWNYGQVMSRLPGEGLDPDGVHPSIPPSGNSAIFTADQLRYGYTMRNLTALHALYTLWQQVLYDGDSAPPATLPPAATQIIVEPPGNTPTGCANAPAARLTVGGQGRVTPGLPNKMRSAPSINAAQVGNIPGEGVFTVVGGPECADGFLWWQVNYDGSIGWTASGDSSEYWVEPVP